MEVYGVSNCGLPEERVMHGIDALTHYTDNSSWLEIERTETGFSATAKAYSGNAVSLMRENRNQIMVEALGIIWSGRTQKPIDFSVTLL